MALFSPPAWPASAIHSAPSISPTSLAHEIHRQVNDVRVAHGLSPLSWTEELASVATGHSRDMADHAFFGHTNQQGQDPGDRARLAGLPDRVQVGSYVVEGIGENLFLTHRYRSYQIFRGDDGAEAYVFDWKTEQEIAQEAVAGWMQSPTHRANVLSSFYQGAAVGVVHSTNEALFITQNFSCRGDLALAGQ